MHDNPVAMPDPYGYEYRVCSHEEAEPFHKARQAVECEGEITLEEYFKKLQLSAQSLDEEFSVKSAQVGGDHYQKAALQPWDIFLAWGLDPWAANVVKYILRFPYKNGLEDLKKAKHYVDFLIEHYDEVHEKYYEKGQD